MQEARSSPPVTDRLAVAPCRPVLFGDRRGLLGLLTQARSEVAGRPAILLMNAGLVHRVGPNRLNVKIARRLAEAGYTTLRFDLAGFGDSAPRTDGLPFEEAGIKDLQAAMDFLTSTRKIERFIPIGLCSGADLSLSLAARDPRVAGAVLVDSFAFDTLLHHLWSYGQRVIAKDSWRNLLTGRSDVVKRFEKRMKLALASNIAGPPPIETEWKMPHKEIILGEVRSALDREARLFFVYSGGPAYHNYLTHFQRELWRLGRNKPLERMFIREADHTFTLAYHQELLLSGILRWLEHSSWSSAPTTPART